MQDVAELKTVMILNGNKRLPHLEVEIFASKQLTNTYLSRLARTIEIPSTCKNNTDRARIITYYAIFVFQHRWTEAEAVIATSPKYAYHYAWRVLKTKWPEAEAVIKTDIHWWKEYCEHFDIN